MKKYLILLLLPLLFFVSCKNPTQTGTIHYIDLEGGFYGITTSDGKHYDPINLDPAFKKDGLRVTFEAETAQDVMTTRMWGQPVRLLKIRNLE